MVFRKRRGGYCPRCGNPIDLKHDAYCMRCGYQVQRKRVRKRGGLFKILLIILIILAVIAAVRYYQGKPLIPDFSFLKNLSR